MSVPSNFVQQQGLGSQSADQMNTAVQTVASLAALRGFVGVGQMEIALQGYVSQGDGGQGLFVWNATATGPDDGQNVIQPTGITTGAWIRLASAGPGLAFYPNLVGAGGAVASRIPSGTQWVETGGYYTVGDGGGGGYVPAAAGAGPGKFQSSDGAWWAYVVPSGGANVRTFGAKGDGATDDSAAISNALSYLTGIGGTVFFPASANPYVFQNITVSAWNNITFQGEAPSTNAAGGAQLLLAAVASSGFLVSSLSGVWFRNLTFLSPSAASPPTQTSGYYVQYNDCNTSGMVNVQMVGAWNGLYITGNCTSLFVDRWFCRNFGNDGCLINSSVGGAMYFDHVQMDQDSAAYTPNAGFEIQAGSDIRITNTDILHCHQDLLINPSAGGFVEWCYFTNCAFDITDFSLNAGGRPVLIAPTGTASVSGLQFENLWTSSGYIGFEIRGTAATSIKNIQISNWQAINNYRQGMLATYCYGLSIINPQVLSNSVQTNGTYAGVEFETGVNSIFISGGNIGGAQAGFTGLHSYNVQTDAGFTGVLNMTGVDLSVGFNTGIFNFVGGVLGAGSEISQCPGWNPLGIGPITVTGSPFTYRAGSTRESITITGGAVSSIAIGGDTVFTSTEKTISLSPLQSVVVTYSGMPTMYANRA